MFRLIVMVVLCMSSIATWASKDKGVYVGGGVSLINVGVEDPFSNQVNFKAGEIMLGYKHSRFVGIEFRYGRALQDETLAVEEQLSGLRDTVVASIDNFSSLYYRAEIANEIAKLYVIVGQSEVATALDFDESTLDFIESVDTGLSYGIGFGLWLDERMNLNFEAKTLVNTDQDSFISSSITADYRF